MNLTLGELKNAARGLAADERAELAQFLLDSLDDEDEGVTRAEWLALAEQRMAEVRAGKVVGIPADQALRQRQIQEITREVFEQRKDAYQRLA